MAQRATSLGPKPSLFFIFFVFVFCFICFSFVWFLIEKACFYPKRGLFVYFSVFPLFLFSLFGPPPVSRSLSLSFSSSFLSFFFSVSHFCIWFLIFLFVLFAFLFQDVI